MLIYICINILLFLIFLILLKNNQESFVTSQGLNTCNIDNALIAGNSIKQCVINCKRDNNQCENNVNIINVIKEQDICNNNNCNLKEVPHNTIIKCLENNTLDTCEKDACFKKCVNCNDPSRCRWNYSYDNNKKISGGKLPQITCDNNEILDTDTIGNIKLNKIIDENINNIALIFTVPEDIIDIFDTCSTFNYDKDTFIFIVKINDVSNNDIYKYPIIHLKYNYCKCNPNYNKNDKKYEFRIDTIKYKFKVNNVYEIKVALKRNSDILNYKKIEYESNEVTLFLQDSLKKIPKNVVNSTDIINELLQKPIQITI